MKPRVRDRKQTCWIGGFVESTDGFSVYGCVGRSARISGEILCNWWRRTERSKSNNGTPSSWSQFSPDFFKAHCFIDTLDTATSFEQISPSLRILRADKKGSNSSSVTSARNHSLLFNLSRLQLYTSTLLHPYLYPPVSTLLHWQRISWTRASLSLHLSTSAR